MEQTLSNSIEKVGERLGQQLDKLSDTVQRHIDKEARQ
jgi:hypothetical protein